jgi:hypothetical protein
VSSSSGTEDGLAANLSTHAAACWLGSASYLRLSAPPTTAAADVELEVIGVIRHKILFKDRPKALISSNPFSFSTSVDSGFAWNVADSFSRCSSEPPTKEKKTLQSAAA